jgi:hypothetical protein
LTKYGQVVSASIGADFNGRIFYTNSTRLTDFQLNRLRFYVDPSPDYTSEYRYFSSTQNSSTFELLANDTIKTEPVDVIPISSLTTNTISSITNTTAIGGGNINATTDDVVIARGVVWSTTSSPTIDLSTKTVDGSGSGSFTNSITGLSPGITYYVRAYATNSNRTDYGAQVSFTSLKVPTVAATSAATSITYYTALMGGSITSDNGVAITARGFVYATAATTSTPSLTNSITTVSGTTGSYTGTITGLIPNTTYYVSSYATNSQGTNYGTPVSFTTPAPAAGSGLSQATAPASGYDLAQNFPTSPSGWYWIKPAGQTNAIQMYVDMTEEGGGYDFYFITAGPSISTVNAADWGGKSLGLDLVMPRSPQHWRAMANAVNAAITSNPSTYGSSFSNYFQTAYGVYNTSAGNYTTYIMRDPTYYGTSGASTNLPANSYRVKDGGRWWLRNTTYGEPNGDYGANGLLGMNGVITYPYTATPTATDVTFNDLTSNYSTGSYYLVSTNKKP